MHTLFDSFFAPTTIVVVSEERLKAAELKQKEKQLIHMYEHIQQLQEHYDKLKAEVDLLKSSDKEPQSLEEALTGV